MNYIWDRYLANAKRGISTKEIEFISASNPSPYVEVALDDLNPVFFDNETPVNAYYRFGAIFGNLTENEDINFNTKNTLFTILIHFLAEFDLHEGLSKKAYYTQFLKDDILSGVFGNKEILEVFSYNERNSILENIFKLYTTGPTIQLFKTILKNIYPQSMVYLDAVDRKTLLIYIGKKASDTLEKQVAFIMDTFIPMDYHIELFWDIHFGIISVDETMVLDDTMIY